MKKVSKCLVGVAVILILAAFCPKAMALGFSVDDIYNSVFVISTDRAIGSGFAVSENEVVTNAHVISDARKISILTYNGEEIPAVVEAYDEQLDLAVLSIERGTLLPLPFASLEEVQAGDDVYAVGAPKSMAYTLTKGIISSKSRMIQGQEYIQVDAAVNEGNSGGPLLDAEGHVLGVITLKMLDAEGIGMAIPITVVSRWLENPAPVATQAPTTPIQTSQPEAYPSENEVANQPSYNRSMEKTNAGLVIALFVSVLLNIALIVTLCLTHKKKKKEPVHSPDSTDFEIEFLK